jgi:hypothetical protein
MPAADLPKLAAPALRALDVAQRNYDCFENFA